MEDSANKEVIVIGSIPHLIELEIYFDNPFPISSTTLGVSKQWLMVRLPHLHIIHFFKYEGDEFILISGSSWVEIATGSKLVLIFIS
jgi:hypothetical protein